MRSSAALASTGPASFSTSLRTGVAACAASAMPISPPIEVPTQCTASTSSRAISVTMSATYCGTALSIGSASRSESPRPATSGQTTRNWPHSSRATLSKSRAERLAHLAPGRVERGELEPAGPQQRQLPRFEIRAAHRVAVIGVARALDRRLLFVIPEPFLDEAEGEVFERRVGRIGLHQLEDALAAAEIRVLLGTRRVADERVVAFPAHHGENQPAVLGDADIDSRRACLRGSLLHHAAVLEHGAAAHAVVLPFRFNAQLGKVARCRGKGRKRDAVLRLEAILQHTVRVVLGVVLGIDVTHHQPAQALAEVCEPPGAGDAHHRPEQAQPSYLNDSARRARNCTTLPSSIFTSSFSISAMRRSRKVPAAVLTALRTASSHEVPLVPITSVTR